MILSVAFVWLVQLFRLSLNYAGVENLQFEDDEYYYYVRAVPKNNITKADKNVKRYNAHNFIRHHDDAQDITEANKENEEHNDSAGEDFDHNFDFTVSLDDEYINNIEKKEK